MLKSELIEIITKKSPHISKQDCESVVRVILSTLQNSLEEGHRVELRGFGSFNLKNLDTKMGRNPKTGEAIVVPSKSVVRFKASKVLLERMNSNSAYD